MHEFASRHANCEIVRKLGAQREISQKSNTT